MLLQDLYLYSLYTRNLSSIFFVSVLDLLQAEAFESSCFECVNKSTISSFVLFLGHTKYTVRRNSGESKQSFCPP